ncbi:PQQ-dependent sugar dehydrogenase [Devosia neptuniae]|uniref:PQQ-dependent sugar dehydrogenase n=1 Tax=Devosia neptuniae TaxID=191302 RepID=A0ABY6C8Q2_9HYPH|nr:PQQ-dependent sugar dehydrogenase [Devosia neptuniae]UXN68614.1 PQQ-dependent sugar dehydrogenase [Devosia neptuniae]
MFHLSPSRLPVLTGTALALLLAAPASAQTIETSAGPLTATVIAEGLEHPWAMGFLPDGRMLVTERSGQLRVVGQDGEVGAPIEGVPEVVARGQGGLLDVALAPDFAESGRIYLSFSEAGEGGHGTAVLSARLALEGDSGSLSEQNVIFRMNKFTGTDRHYGSRIVIGQDGNLFVTLGERGEAKRAQDMADLAGAVVRIAPDGSIPADNPKLEGWAAELWSKGHRNPQGATLRQSDGALFTVEHGARGGDEINMPRAGRNYGWPVITYGVDYSGAPIGEGTEQEGLEQPLHYWDPSISPSGLTFYDAELIEGWQGDLITGGLSGQVMVRLDMEGDTVVGEEPLFEGQLGRIRDVRVGPDGAIYALTDEGNGQVIRVAPEGV